MSKQKVGDGKEGNEDEGIDVSKVKRSEKHVLFYTFGVGM